MAPLSSCLGVQSCMMSVKAVESVCSGARLDGLGRPLRPAVVRALLGEDTRKM